MYDLSEIVKTWYFFCSWDGMRISCIDWDFYFLCHSRSQVCNSQGKQLFFQGQEKISEICIWSGKLLVCIKIEEILITLNTLNFFLLSI